MDYGKLFKELHDRLSHANERWSEAPVWSNNGQDSSKTRLHQVLSQILILVAGDEIQYLSVNMTRTGSSYVASIFTDKLFISAAGGKDVEVAAVYAHARSELTLMAVTSAPLLTKGEAAAPELRVVLTYATRQVTLPGADGASESAEDLERFLPSLIRDLSA